VGGWAFATGMEASRAETAPCFIWAGSVREHDSPAPASPAVAPAKPQQLEKPRRERRFLQAGGRVGEAFGVAALRLRACQGAASARPENRTIERTSKCRVPLGLSANGSTIVAPSGPKPTRQGGERPRRSLFPGRAQTDPRPHRAGSKFCSVIQSRCRITAIFLAQATLATRLPRRSATLSPQVFSALWVFEWVSITDAPS
jgi:hypothetical protein